MKVAVYTIKGEKKEEIDISLPEVDMTPEEFSQVIRVYTVNLHQGTKKAKTRGEVAHSDRKPWRQKGTGRARAGSVNSPIWVGGGVAHGPKPYTKRLSLNKKQKKRALAYMLWRYLLDGRIVVLEEDMDKINTKSAFSFLKQIGWHPFKVQVIVPVKDEVVAKSFRNLDKVRIRRAQLLSPFDLYRNTYLVVTRSALDILTKRLGK